MANRHSSKPNLIYTHRVGDRVTWNLALLAVSRHHAQISMMHGSGPFVVLATYHVPPTNQRTVGHHQWLNVNSLFPDQTLSGAWFVPMER